MVALSQLISFAIPSVTFGIGGKVNVSQDGSGERITFWDAQAIGPAPSLVDGIYPSLEAHRAAAEAAQPPDIETLIADLEGIFDSAPFEAQVAFLSAYTDVKRAIRDFKIGHAAAYVGSISSVPPELRPVQAALLTRIQQSI